MKKVYKKIIAYVLAAAMLIPSVPMMEAKANEPTTIFFEAEELDSTVDVSTSNNDNRTWQTHSSITGIEPSGGTVVASTKGSVSSTSTPPAQNLIWNFTTETTGTHYIWVRHCLDITGKTVRWAFSVDDEEVDVATSTNGVAITQSTTLIWEMVATKELSTVTDGKHKLTLSGYSSGAKPRIDCFYITTDANFVPPTSASAPTADLASATYEENQTLTLATATDAATIYYNVTTDGTEPADPTAESTAYANAISLEADPGTSVTYKIKAMAAVEKNHAGMSNSEVVSLEYTIAPPAIEYKTVFFEAEEGFKNLDPTEVVLYGAHSIGDLSALASGGVRLRANASGMSANGVSYAGNKLQWNFETENEATHYIWVRYLTEAKSGATTIWAKLTINVDLEDTGEAVTIPQSEKEYAWLMVAEKDLTAGAHTMELSATQNNSRTSLDCFYITTDPNFDPETYVAPEPTPVPTYTITWDVDGETTTETYEYGATPSFKGSTDKAATEQYTYTFTGWDKELATVTGDVTYTAQFEASIRTYTVTWDVAGDITSETVEYNMTPVSAPTNPTKEMEGYTYTFQGWKTEGSDTVYTAETVPAVTGDVTYKAVFTETKNTYTVTWDVEGTTTETTYAHGEVPVYGGETPTKPGDAQYTYTFAGWNNGTETIPVGIELPAVTGDVTYKAEFTETKNTYTVTWVDEYGTTLDTAEVAYGEVPEFNGTTDKEPDAQYTYTFTGWDNEFVAVTGDVTYTAQYDKTLNKYEITWLDDEGNELRTDTVAYGETPAFGADPTKTATAEYTYTFKGWTPEVVTVAGNATYKAEFTETKNTYTVTWVDEDGTELEKDEKVEYGTMPSYDGADPTKAATAEYTYTFKSWTPEVATVTGDVTYTAQYDQADRIYTIKWVDFEGNDIVTPYELTLGAAIEEPTEVPAFDGYPFIGWDKDVAATVTGEEDVVTYTAIYDINGIYEDYYYEKGKIVGAKGVVDDAEGNLYYVRYSGKIAKGHTVTIADEKTNGKIPSGTYYVFENGVIETDEVKLNGEIGEDGYYYVNGEKRGAVGLVEIEGYYYYVQYSGKVVKGRNAFVSADKSNGYEVEEGTYYFYTLNGVMKTTDVELSGKVEDGKYYVFGELTGGVGLVRLANSDYVYVNYSGSVKQSGLCRITDSNCNIYTDMTGLHKVENGIFTN